MDVAVLNAGGWGTALAVLLARNGHTVTLWCRRPELAAQLAAERENRVYLPGVALPPAVEPTADLGAALAGRAAVVVAAISGYVRELARACAPRIAPGAIVLHGTKGFEQGTLLRMSEVLAAELGPAFAGRIAALGGPTHAEEVGRGIPTAAVVACGDPAVAAAFQRLLNSPVFRVYTNPDLVGVEVCAAVKNVMALAAGVSDGLGYGDNAKAALLTRFLAELRRLVVALGGQPDTVAGLAGVGDIVGTCTSRHSRNRWAGEQLGRGVPLAAVLASRPQVVEGVPATRATLELAQRHGVEMPITEQVHATLFAGKSPLAALADLMARELVGE